MRGGRSVSQPSVAVVLEAHEEKARTKLRGTRGLAGGLRHPRAVPTLLQTVLSRALC